MFELNDNQKSKLDNLVVEQLSQETLFDLIKVSKVIQGEESLNEFEYEYDEDLDEINQVNIALEDVKATIPTIYNKIVNMDGNQIFRAMENNKFCRFIANTRDYENKIEEIKENTKLSQDKKDKQVSIRKQMRKEYLELKELNGHLNSNTCWKIWKIKEGQKAKKELLEDLGQDKLEKEIAKVKYLGNNFIKECKDIAFQDED